ncbi:AraC family transcriptional regulator [Arcobacter sp. HD9-500m-PIT-SAG02]|nr:AraC family transcriptional regulator [Arcobacter sp. HD9-500m-PIT-SAG02]
MDIIYVKNINSEDIVLCGAMDKSIIIPIASQDYHFGIRFKPSILSFLLNQSCDKFTNKIISIREVSGSIFKQLNFEETHEKLKIKKLNFIFEKLFIDIQINQSISSCINKITASKGTILIRELVNESSLNHKQIERTFLWYVGFSPKKFARIIRFFNAHKSLIQNGIGNLTNTAYELGYTDQPHFNKDYKTFTQMSPTDKKMSIFYNTNK